MKKRLTFCMVIIMTFILFIIPVFAEEGGYNSHTGKIPGGETITTIATPQNGSMAEMLDICESSGFLQVLYIITLLFKIMCYLVPFALIIMLTLDISKVVTDPEAVKKVISASKKRIIAALILVFVPTIMNVVTSLLNEKSTIATCLDHANPGYIDKRKEYEKEYFTRTTRATTKKTTNANSQTHTTRPSSNSPTTYESLLDGKSGWREIKRLGENKLNYYIYVPENATTNMPLITIWPGQEWQDYWDKHGINWNAKLLKDFFEQNYGTNKRLKYSRAFIVILNLSYNERKWDSQVRDIYYELNSRISYNRNASSMVGFSSGGWNMYSFAFTHRNNIPTSAIVPVSTAQTACTLQVDKSSSGCTFSQEKYNFYKALPIMQYGERYKDHKMVNGNSVDCGGSGIEWSAYDAMNSIKNVLGKEMNYSDKYCHGDTYHYVLTKDDNRNGYNDYIEWMLSKGKNVTITTSQQSCVRLNEADCRRQDSCIWQGGRCKPKMTTTKPSTSDFCYNPLIQVTGKAPEGEIKWTTIRTDNFAVTLYSDIYNNTKVDSLWFHENISNQTKNILNKVSNYVKNNSDIIPKFQTGGSRRWSAPMSHSYHTQGFAIDLFNQWSFTKDGKTYNPYNSQGEDMWNRYSKFICEVCNGIEDCKYNINYQIYKNYFKANNWCWGGFWNPSNFDPMHFEVAGVNGQCASSTNRKITCN